MVKFPPSYRILLLHSFATVMMRACAEVDDINIFITKLVIPSNYHHNPCAEEAAAALPEPVRYRALNNGRYRALNNVNTKSTQTQEVCCQGSHSSANACALIGNAKYVLPFFFSKHCMCVLYILCNSQPLLIYCAIGCPLMLA